MPPKLKKVPDIPLPRILHEARQEHPGLPDKPRTKKTSAEVQAEKAAKEQAALEKDKSRGEDVAQTALLEKKMRQEYEEKVKNANHPPANSQKKVLRTRKMPDAATSLLCMSLPKLLSLISS
jgi:hypothetical protein